MFPVLIPHRQRIALSFHALHDGMVRWMKPRSTSFLLGTITDLAKGKSELLVENALLRQQLIILRRQVKRPICLPADRFLLVLLARVIRNWKQALFIVQPETLLRWPRGLFRLFWKRKSKVRSSEPKLSPETIVLIKEMAANHRLWGAERIRGELLTRDIRRSQTDHAEVDEADSRHFELVDRAGRLSCAIMRQRCRG
jgi:putative transposase